MRQGNIIKSALLRLRKPLLWFGLLIGMLAACVAALKPDVALWWSKTPFWVYPTSKLVRDPAKRANVDKLARFGRVTSPRVGPDGEPSPEYQAYEAVVESAAKDEVIRLLRHESPVVRTYMARHIIYHWPEDAPALRRLLSDEAWVETLDGCIAGGVRVGGWILGEMCSDAELLARAPIQAFVLETAKDDGSAYHGAALECVSRVKPKEAATLGMSLLKREKNPAILAQVVRALGHANATEAAPAIIGLRYHADPRVRGAVFDALAELNVPEGLGVLKAGLYDGDPLPRRRASEALNKLGDPKKQ